MQTDVKGATLIEKWLSAIRCYWVRCMVRFKCEAWGTTYQPPSASLSGRGVAIPVFSLPLHSSQGPYSTMGRACPSTGPLACIPGLSEHMFSGVHRGPLGVRVRPRASTGGLLAKRLWPSILSLFGRQPGPVGATLAACLSIYIYFPGC